MAGRRLARDARGRVTTTTALLVVMALLLFGGWWSWRSLQKTSRRGSPTPAHAIAPQEEAPRAGTRVLASPLLVEPEQPPPSTQELLDQAHALRANGDTEAARAMYRQIIELDPDNPDARRRLGYHSYDGKWFATYEELSRYRREEAKRQLEEHGLVRFNEEWVPQEDLPYLRKGLTKQEDGTWVKPAEKDGGGR